MIIERVFKKTTGVLSSIQKHLREILADIFVEIYCEVQGTVKRAQSDERLLFISQHNCDKRLFHYDSG